MAEHPPMYTHRPFMHPATLPACHIADLLLGHVLGAPRPHLQRLPQAGRGAVLSLLLLRLVPVALLLPLPLVPPLPPTPPPLV